jgi:hypothetical protein
VPQCGGMAMIRPVFSKLEQALWVGEQTHPQGSCFSGRFEIFDTRAYLDQSLSFAGDV